MRWSSEITLLKETSAHQNSEGIWIEEDKVPVVCSCNDRTIGMRTWGDAAVAGWRVDCEIELRSIDYENEQEAIYNEETLQVVLARRSGENTILTLGERLNNE